MCIKSLCGSTPSLNTSWFRFLKMHFSWALIQNLVFIQNRTVFSTHFASVSGSLWAGEKAKQNKDDSSLYGCLFAPGRRQASHRHKQKVKIVQGGTKILLFLGGLTVTRGKWGCDHRLPNLFTIIINSQTKATSTYLFKQRGRMCGICICSDGWIPILWWCEMHVNARREQLWLLKYRSLKPQLTTRR